ncbi:MAG: tRNA (adenosine(37)-N6)-threonylcarbamoyltransferase complex ATPase subunit type 1 TsaE [Pikeienuella sp.]
MFEVLLPDAAATDRVGAALGISLRQGDVLCLSGDLGAGKTALARAAIAARLATGGMAEDIPSPTFTLVQTYQADIPLWHADLYRLSDEEEVWELGLVDAFSDAACLIEWPDRLGTLTPARRLEISLTMAGDGRRLSVTPLGENWAHIADIFTGAI